MAQHDPTPPITEPELVHCLFTTGVAVEVRAHFARIVAWVDLPGAGPDNASERRIIARLVLPDDTARELARLLRRELSRGGH